MLTKDFNFELPEELIAQTPLEQRDHSRLLVVNRSDETLLHRQFYQLPDFLRPGDCLVLNDTRVLPARLLGHKTSGAAVEFLLLKSVGYNRWQTLVRPGNKCKPGAEFEFGDGRLKATVAEVAEEGTRIVQFQCQEPFEQVLDQLGHMPLPPYITESLKDRERYQTVYANATGSAAAPTAGLHFTDALMDRIKAMGVDIQMLTLHVGLGTFRPVKAEKITEHVMHSEYYSVDQKTADAINACKERGGRVISVGTTSTRTLETLADDGGRVRSGSGWTDIFIYPGYNYKVVDGLITNFHLPESTLIMLVCALGGSELIMRAYLEAVAQKYRFFSFGDSMLVL